MANLVLKTLSFKNNVFFHTSQGNRKSKVTPVMPLYNVPKFRT